MYYKEVTTLCERRKEKATFGKRIGDHLRTIRKKHQWSQERLSLSAGYTTTYVSKIERGLYSPSLHTIWRLARTMNLSLTEFFKEFEE